MKSIEECLKWFAEREQPKESPIYDFQRPLPPICPWCHYPFNTSSPGHISWIDCPEHRPGHFKYFDRAQKIIKEALNESAH